MIVRSGVRDRGEVAGQGSHPGERDDDSGRSARLRTGVVVARSELHPPWDRGAAAVATRAASPSHPRPAAASLRRRDPLHQRPLVVRSHPARLLRSPASLVRRRSSVARCRVLICALTGSRARPSRARQDHTTSGAAGNERALMDVHLDGHRAGGVRRGPYRVVAPGGVAVRPGPASSCPRSPGRSARRSAPGPGRRRSAPRSSRRAR